MDLQFKRYTTTVSTGWFSSETRHVVGFRLTISDEEHQLITRRQLWHFVLWESENYKLYIEHALPPGRRLVCSDRYEDAQIVEKALWKQFHIFRDWAYAPLSAKL